MHTNGKIRLLDNIQVICIRLNWVEFIASLILLEKKYYCNLIFATFFIFMFFIIDNLSTNNLHYTKKAEQTNIDLSINI